MMYWHKFSEPRPEAQTHYEFRLVDAEGDEFVYPGVATLAVDSVTLASLQQGISPSTLMRKRADRTLPRSTGTGTSSDDSDAIGATIPPLPATLLSQEMESGRVGAAFDVRRPPAISSELYYLGGRNGTYLPFGGGDGRILSEYEDERGYERRHQRK